jgi:hypothetical protein
MDNFVAMAENDQIANDQIAARCRVEFDQHVESTQQTLAEAAENQISEVDALAIIATTMIQAPDEMPRKRLASLLAVALVRAAKPASRAEVERAARALANLDAGPAVTDRWLRLSDAVRTSYVLKARAVLTAARDGGPNE